MRAALLVLAVARLAGTLAEVVHVLEDFSDAQRFFTDSGQSLGPGFWDSGAMNLTTTTEGVPRVDYDVYWTQFYGYVQFGRILCSGGRAAGRTAPHLVGAARAQVVPPDERHARRGRAAFIA